MWVFVIWLGCGGAPAPECPPCPDSRPGPSTADTLELDAWQQEQLRPISDRLKAGIVPLPESGFGVCRGRTSCEEFLGPAPGVLAEGDYVVRAEVSVPDIGTGWKVRFENRCTTTSAADRQTERNYERVYDVGATPGGRGYRLEPMWRIQSPRKEGSQNCTFRLIPIRPDGAEGEPLTGSYQTIPPPLTDQ